MANKKITDLVDIGTPASGDLLEIVDVSEGVSKRVAVSALGGGDTPTLQEVLAEGNYANRSINLDVVGEGAVINFTDGNPDSGGEIQGSFDGDSAGFRYSEPFTGRLLVINLPESGASAITAPETISEETIATREWVEDNVSGGVESVTGDGVDNTDPLNPVINCIPLSGTTVGNPVTNDIEFSSDGVSLKQTFGFIEKEIRFPDDAGIFFKVEDTDLLQNCTLDITTSGINLNKIIQGTSDVSEVDPTNKLIYAQRWYVYDTLKNAIITVELIDSLEVDFYATDDLKINSFTLIVGSGTITIEVNDSAYTLGTVINQGDKITVSTTTASVVNLIGKYE